MPALFHLSDAQLVARLPALVRSERHAVADVIEHLVEMERRRLYLSLAVSSLYRYCIDRLGYAEDAALKRHRVAKLALRLPQVLDELRAGTIHLTGLFLLSQHLTDDNAGALLSEACGKSRRQIEEIIACWFPRPDVPPSLLPMNPEGSVPAEAAWLTLGAAPAVGAREDHVTCSKTGKIAGAGRARLEALSPSRLRVEFTARAELYERLERARELLSHALPSGDLGELFERALDALLEQEIRKRFGADKAGSPRKPIHRAPTTRQLKPGSRHVRIEIERAVWERDSSQCTFVDDEGRRCAERRFLTIEHRTPFALGGPPTLENLCLLCSAHNLANARQVFGERHIEAMLRERTPVARAGGVATPPAAQPALETAGKVVASLASLGFRKSEASSAVGRVLGSEPARDVEQLLRTCPMLLVPKAS